jgi:hypothetical protein
LKAYGGVDVQIHVFLPPALVGEWSASSRGRFILYPGIKTMGTHWIGDRVGPRGGPDDVEKILAPTGTRSPTQLVASRYAGSLYYAYYSIIARKIAKIISRLYGCAIAYLGTNFTNHFEKSNNEQGT